MQRSMGRARTDSGHNGANSSTANGTIYEELDALIVGAGFAGCYLLNKLRKHNFKAKIVDAAGDLGGVWYWNRYPGARVDSHYPHYALNESEVWKDWYWSERYPGSDELRRYFAHIDKVLDIKKDTEFNTKVEAAEFDANTNKWTVHYDDGRTVVTRFFIAAIGFAARRHFPDWKGLDTFKGTIHHSSFWPLEGVDVRGKKMIVVGTGATGIQITQQCAKEIGDDGSLTVFQRTPNIAIPMRQRDMTKEEQDLDKQHYEEIFRKRLDSIGGFDLSPLMVKHSDVPVEERFALYESLWQTGGFNVFICLYYDIALDPQANREIYDFWARKTRARITDPETRDLLAPLEPPHCWGGKRPSLEVDFYEQFSRPNVNVVSSRKTPIQEVVSNGVVTADGRLHEADIIALATGFDAVTGGIRDIKLQGLGGETLTDHWKDGTYTYLGMTISGFPNLMMMYGPQSPTAFSNGPSCVEPQAEWILQVMLDMRQRGLTRINADRDAELAWKKDVFDLSARTLRHSVDGWYNGANIPGKVKEPMNYTGGLGTYIGRIKDAFNDGAYKGFTVQ